MHKIRIVFWGDSIGKSSIVSRLLKKDFSDYYIPTLGMAFDTKTVRQTAYEMLDAGGNECFKPLSLHYSSCAQIICLAFDRRIVQSFEKLKKDISLLKLSTAANIEFVLLETRSDLVKSSHPEEVREGDILQFKKQHLIQHHIVTSAKEDLGIKELKNTFITIAEHQTQHALPVVGAAAMPKKNIPASFMIKCYHAVTSFGSVALLAASIVTLSPYVATASGALMLLSARNLFFKNQHQREQKEKSMELSCIEKRSIPSAIGT